MIQTKMVILLLKCQNYCVLFAALSSWQFSNENEFLSQLYHFFHEKI